MFVYFVNYFNWSDSVYYPVFHEKEFSKSEFKEVCDEVASKVIENIHQHNEDLNLRDVSISKFDLLDGIVEMLCSEYGFVRIDVLAYDIEDGIVDAHRRF